MRMRRLNWILAATVAFALVSSGSAVAAPAPSRVAVIIGFNQQPGPPQQALVRQAGGTIKYTYHLVPAIAATVPEPAIAGLLANPNVARIDLDGEVHIIDHPTGDTELDSGWGVAHIGAGAVHGGGNKGTGVKVAVIDSGIYYTHPDLDGNFAGGKDFVNDDNDPLDDNGHGTHVAGTIAAEDNNLGVVGVAPEADLYALKVLSSSGNGSWSDIIAALQWAVDNGIQVTNNSYGSSLNPGGTVKAAFDNSAAAGVIHVAAAGNSGNPRGKGNNVGYPARFASVIAVAATDSGDNRASFSSTGDTVELAAPGVVINSTLLGGGYGTANGTSMASPHVAGTAALVIAAGIADVRTQLQTTADDLGATGRDAQYGYGLVDADEAAPLPAGNQAPVADAGLDQTVNTGSTVQLDGSNSSDPNGDTITYVWVFTSWPDGSNATLSEADTATPSFVADKDGSYQVELTVSDGELSSSDSVEITAATATEATTVTVASIDYTTGGGKNQDKHLFITVALVDDLGSSVGGASVSIDLFRDGSFVASGTGTTDTDGTVTFSLNNAASGCYTTTIDGVTATGLTWDLDTPTNSFCK
ncbi:MAG: S8 family serine peptidase [Acidimicrobiia bacterium]